MHTEQPTNPVKRKIKTKGLNSAFSLAVEQQKHVLNIQ